MNNTFHRFSAADTVENSKQKNSRDNRQRITFILRKKANFRQRQFAPPRFNPGYESLFGASFDEYSSRRGNLSVTGVA